MITYYGKDASVATKEYVLGLINSPPHGAVAFDIETVSLKERLPLDISIAFSPDEAINFNVHPEAPKELELLKVLMSRSDICKIGHNILFDLGVLPMIPHMELTDRSNIFDTNTASRLLGKVVTDLPFLAATELNPPMLCTPAKEMLAGGKNMLDIDPAVRADKCQRDARATYALYLKYKPMIESRYGEYFKIEMAIIPILIAMSMKGIMVDQDARVEMTTKIEEEVEVYKRMLTEAGIEKPGSAQQVGYILGKRGNFLPLTRSKRQLSTNEANLQFLEDPIATAVLEYRGKSKLLSTYLYPMAEQDRFYTEYYLDTVVGRMNSRNRNIQNIPPSCRHILLPDNGCYTSMDYRMEHLYILAHMSGDRDMLRILYDPDPEKSDIHQHTASQMNISRRLAKTVNYSMPYGGTAKTIKDNGKIKDIGLCSRLLDSWGRTYPGAWDWIRNAKREGVKDGWSLPTLFGRRIIIPQEYNQYNTLYVEGMERKAVNYPILGSDGEVIKRAILMCSRGGLGPPIMTITAHDSIDFDGDVELPVEEMEMIPGFKIPIEVKKTFTWE